MTIGEDNAAAVLDEFDTVQDFSTSGGNVRIQAVEAHPDSPSAIIVWTGFLEPHQDTVIVNPPIYLPDPDGDTEVNGVMYRRDPVAAVAEVIGMHGGGAS